MNLLFTTIFYTALALMSFAANSVLGRLALGDRTIDASAFTLIRLLSGVITLFILVGLTHKVKEIKASGSWLASLMLFMYAVTFSYGYLLLSTGMGALILFASVQLTLLILTIFQGAKLHSSEWFGMSLAFGGFIYLVFPGLSAPSFLGFILMSAAGIAWAIYTYKGKGSLNPLLDTSFNFLRTLPFLACLFVLTYQEFNVSPKGMLLAVISGGITSGMGYAIWYKALKNLSSIQSAVLQLLVPVLATLGGVIFVNEKVTLRLIIASFLVIGGILLVILGKRLAPFERKNIKSFNS